MNIINLRKTLRRSNASRRMADRRVAPYAFGTPEWIENIEKSHLAWPKADRRVAERRVNERRSPDRRSRQASEQARAGRKYSRILLTSEERKLIEDVYLSDM